MVSLVVISGILLVTVMVVISIYNKLVRYRNLMEEAWSGIDVFLKKRHDLVPNLVNVVKGYATHEKQLFEDLTRLRSQAMQAKGQDERMDSETGLGQALGRMMAVVESYPDLKANQNFLQLQRQLAELEEELALSRRYYNGTVRQSNTYVESFPSNIIAGMFGFVKRRFFEIDKAEKTVPVISV